MNNINISVMFNVRLLEITYFLNWAIRLLIYISHVLLISSDEGKICWWVASIKEAGCHGMCQGKFRTSRHNTKLKK